MRTPPRRDFQAGDLAADQQAFLLGQAVDLAGIAHMLEAVELLDALVHGGPVGEHAAQPALGHVGHPTAVGLFADGLLRLALGADEEHVAALGYHVAHDVIGYIQGFYGLLEVDDVDTVALGEDVGAHARVPLVGAVTEVDAAFQQSFHRYDCCHCCSPLRLASAPVIPARRLTAVRYAPGRSESV